MKMIRATEVFTPADFPTHTYVERGEEKLERRLKDALDTPGEIISLSGPSKSGKTVLVERVVGQENLITIPGAGLRNADDLWDKVLDWMDTPNSCTFGQSSLSSSTNKTVIKTKAGIPLTAVGELETGRETKTERGSSTQTTAMRSGMLQVIREIGNSEFVLLIDDFHYIDREVQAEVAKQIKEAARRGVKICTASVPHRSDDVVRSNPELRGRVRAIDLNYWKPAELSRIAEIGFPLLEIMIDLNSIKRFIEESSGSPQLMQAICLQTCFELGIREKTNQQHNITLIDQKIHDIFEVVSTTTDFSSLVGNMHAGPKKRGTERKEFHFTDGSHGDVYRCVLLAILQSPPCLHFPYNELSRRIQNICIEEIPQASSITQACSQICKKSNEMGQRVIEWEDDLLDIIDPYFLFYLRWSGKIKSLAT